MQALWYTICTGDLSLHSFNMIMTVVTKNQGAHTYIGRQSVSNQRVCKNNLYMYFKVNVWDMLTSGWLGW